SIMCSASTRRPPCPTTAAGPSTCSMSASRSPSWSSAKRGVGFWRSVQGLLSRANGCRAGQFAAFNDVSVSQFVGWRAGAVEHVGALLALVREPGRGDPPGGGAGRGFLAEPVVEDQPVGPRNLGVFAHIELDRVVGEREPHVPARGVLASSAHDREFA